MKLAAHEQRARHSDLDHGAPLHLSGDAGAPSGSELNGGAARADEPPEATEAWFSARASGAASSLKRGSNSRESVRGPLTAAVVRAAAAETGKSVGVELLCEPWRPALHIRSADARRNH